MAVIGLSKPFVAKYNNDGNKVTYTGGTVLGKAISFSAELEEGDSNDLYGDNGVCETDKSFSGGTMTIGTDELTNESSALILGITPAEDGELVYDDDMTAPYLGFGCVVKKKHNNVFKWRAVVFPKIMFNIPAEAAETQGETIEWQTPELTASILRDDTEKHAWKRESTFETEAEAVAYIKGKLGITDAA